MISLQIWVCLMMFDSLFVFFPLSIPLVVWLQTMRKDPSVVSSLPQCMITSCPHTAFRSAWGHCTCCTAFTSHSLPGQRKRCRNRHCHHNPSVSFVSGDLCISLFPFQIWIALKDWTCVQEFVSDAVACQHLDVVYVYSKLVSEKAFLCTAMPNQVHIKEQSCP